MPNPISVPIVITESSADLYIAVDAYADNIQRADIQCPDGQMYTAEGQKGHQPEGTRIGYWKYPIKNAGTYTFVCRLQYDDGSGYKPSKYVSSGSFQVETLHQSVVFSEDSGDQDMNDCFLTFMWFGKRS